MLYHKNNFNGGEIGPIMEARIESDIYKRAAKKLTGCMPLLTGAVRRMSGTRLDDFTNYLFMRSYQIKPIPFATMGGYFVVQVKSNGIWNVLWGDTLRQVWSYTDGDASEIIANYGFSSGITGWTVVVEGAGSVVSSDSDMLLTCDSGRVYAYQEVTAAGAGYHYVLRGWPGSTNAQGSRFDNQRRARVMIGTAPGLGDIAELDYYDNPNRGIGLTMPSPLPTHMYVSVEAINSGTAEDAVFSFAKVSLQQCSAIALGNVFAWDLLKLRTWQTNDTMWLCDGNNFLELKYNGISDDTSMVPSLSLYDFVFDHAVRPTDYPPFEPPDKSGVTITPSAATGTVTLTASSAIFGPLSGGFYLKMSNGSTTGYGIVSATPGGPSTTVQMIVIETIPTGACSQWSWSIWPEGYPGNRPLAIALLHDRLILGGNAKHPSSYWMSAVNDFKNFKYGTADADALDGRLPGDRLSAIRWMEPLGKVILVGTSDGEFAINSGDDSTAWTPATVTADRISNNGSAEDVDSTCAGTDIMYAGNGGRSLRRAARISDSDEVRTLNLDLSIQADHIFKGRRVMAIGYQRHPIDVAWCVLSDGSLYAIVYDLDNKVTGWWEYDLGSGVTAKDICVIPGTNCDKVAVEVQYGSYYMLASVQPPYPFDSIVSAEGYETPDPEIMGGFHVNLGTKRDGVAITSIKVPSVFEGVSLDVSCDGVYQGRKTVSGAAISGLPASGRIIAGLPQEFMIETLPIVAFDKGGSPLALNKINSIEFSLYECGPGLQISCDQITWEAVNTGTDGLFTGKVSALVPEGTHDGSIYIRNLNPYPCTILSITYNLEIAKPMGV